MNEGGESPESSPGPKPPALWFLPYLDESKPWRSRSLLPVKPEGVRLALRDRRGRMTAFDSESEFQDAISGPTELRHRRVAVPSYPRWFPAILLWEPREDVKPHTLAGAMKPLLITLVLGWLFIAPPRGWPLGSPQTQMLVLLALMFFGVMPLGTEIIRWWEDFNDREPDRNKRRQVDLVLFDHWLQTFSPLVLRATVLLFAAVYLLQVFGGVPRMSLDHALAAFFFGGGGVMNSVMDAALVKTAVLQNGEWWRLLTAGVMHGSLLHILFNSSAFYFLGRVTIAMVGVPLLGLVFLVSILAGSLASLWLTAAPASVGASGGVMGILGFLTVILVVHGAGIPRLYKTNLLQAILIMSIFGALGAQFIDNAAHAGGFLAGAVLGTALVPRSKRVWEYRPRIWLRVLGWCSWGVLALAGLHVTRLILGSAAG